MAACAAREPFSVLLGGEDYRGTSPPKAEGAAVAATKVVLGGGACTPVGASPAAKVVLGGGRPKSHIAVTDLKTRGDFKDCTDCK